MIILRVWTKQPGNYFCISSKTPDGEWRDEFFTRKQFKMVPRYIKEQVEDNCDVYWCPHGFTKQRRLKRYAVMPHLLWADIDEVDPTTIKLKPSVLWESSPGRYAGLWTLNTVLSDDEVNKKWTYANGFDKGGWDLTQVLRVPGTQNHKYKGAPRVRLVYDDPRIKYDEVKDIVPHLPQQRQRKGDTEKTKEARHIFSVYKKHLTPWARREMLNGKPARGKRSEVFWKLTNELIEAGADEAEAFTLLWASPWNKFNTRRDGEDQLQREINKVYDNKFTGPEGQADFEEQSEIKAEEDADERIAVSSLLLGSAEPEITDWVLYPYFARGHITLIEGAPEVGKSWFCLGAGASIAEGKFDLPRDDWDHNVRRGMVLYFDMENLTGQTAMRIDDTQMITRHKNHHDSSPFFHIPNEFYKPNLGDDTSQLLDDFDEKIQVIREGWKNNKKYPDKVEMIVFDTLINYSDMTDSNKQGDVAMIMTNMKELALEYDCSVVAIRHHAKSLKDKDPMHRGVGSIQYGASARIVAGIYRHPEDQDQRVVMLSKNNLANRNNIRPLVYSLDLLFPDSFEVDKRDRTKMVWQGYQDLRDTDVVLSQKELDERAKDKEKDNELLSDILSELEATHRVNGHAAEIPLSEIKMKINQTNIPELNAKQLNRELRRFGYTPKGRGRNSYYSREDE